MQIHDDDTQMVRDFLKEANAPFHIKEHFDNLLSEFEKADARAADLRERVNELEGVEFDLKEANENIAALQEEVDDRVLDQEQTLQTVKYWMHDVLVLGKPMTDPRKIMRIIDEALL